MLFKFHPIVKDYKDDSDRFFCWWSFGISNYDFIRVCWSHRNWTEPSDYRDEPLRFGDLVLIGSQCSHNYWSSEVGCVFCFGYPWHFSSSYCCDHLYKNVTCYLRYSIKPFHFCIILNNIKLLFLFCNNYFKLKCYLCLLIADALYIGTDFNKLKHTTNE